MLLIHGDLFKGSIPCDLLITRFRMQYIALANSIFSHKSLYIIYIITLLDLYVDHLVHVHVLCYACYWKYK